MVMFDVARCEFTSRVLLILVVLGDAVDSPLLLGAFNGFVSRHLSWTLMKPHSAVRASGDRIAPDGGVIEIDELWQRTRIVDRFAIRVGRLLERLRYAV